MLNSFVGVLLNTKAITQHATKAAQRFWKTNGGEKTKEYILKVGREQMATEGFNAQLLSRVEEALNSGQIPVSNRLAKLQEMKEMLTPTPPAQQ